MGKNLQEWACNLNEQTRKVFSSGGTRSVEWRLKQLNAIFKLISEQENALNEAAQKDLGKAPFETFCTEIGLAKNSCELVISNLKKWMKPKKVALPLPLQPVSAEVVPEPLGVVLIFSSWNFPIMLAIDPLLGAIAAGNAVVLKLSEVAPAVSAELAKLIPMYLDKDAIKVVEGGIPESEALLKQKWDKIFYTGSATVGRIVMTAAAKHLTPVTLELGGKCPTIVDSNVDLVVATNRIATGKWGINAGQACLAPDYILIKDKDAQTFIDALKKTLLSCYGAEPEKSQDITRIVNARHFARLKSYLDEQNTVKTIIHGGKHNEKTLFFEPTLLLNPPLDSPIMTEEIFGPILPIITVPTMHDAVDFVIKRNKPLSLYLFTDDSNLKKKVADEVSAGSILINDSVVHFGASSIPFGGVGESGMGAYHGKASFDTFSHMKPVIYRTLWGDATVRYPPFTPWKQSILKRLIRFDYFGLLLVMLGLQR